jgi:methyltransferase (TIGR00027 family)
MRGNGEYSRTAEGVALLRALEQLQPPSLRILNDPYAAAFLQDPWLCLIARSWLLSSLMRLFLDRWSPGAQEMINLRARLVDDLAIEMPTEPEQIVILGAGFDSMALRVKDALRVKGALRTVTVFEVDHSGTQCLKQRAFARLEMPADVRFVAVDFECDDFVVKLMERGFAPARRSLIVWLGVTCYLTIKAIRQAMDQIATLGGAGTRLVFDYILADVIDGTSPSRDARRKARRMARLGEPWLFGLVPEKVRDYLAPFGFKLIRDYGAAELRARYCPQRAVPMDYTRIVVCERV